MQLINAVNQVLRANGLHPVSSLEPPTPPDAALALAKIEQVRERVCGEGWAFSTRPGIRLSPDEAGEITVPINTLRADVRDKHIVLLGNKLYDTHNRTYMINHSVVVDIVENVPAELLPFQIINYVLALSAVELCQEFWGDQAREQSLYAQLHSARAEALRYETQALKLNFNFAVPNTLRRIGPQ
jgi:hypothetical protein